MNFLRNIADAIAGWKVNSTMAYLQKIHKKVDYLTLTIFAPETITLFKTESELNNARKDL
jgi:hypothetical protein